MKVSAVLRLLRDEGWRIVTIRGSHRPFKHADRPGRVTVAGKPSGEAVTLHVAGLREDGLPVPEPRRQVDYVEVAA